MIIQIDGASTFNKGGELMLQAVLKAIEEEYPNAEIIWNTKFGAEPVSYLDSSLTIRKPFISMYLGPVLKGLRLEGLFRKLNLPYVWLTPMFLPSWRRVDVIIDSRGYTFSSKLGDKAMVDFQEYYRKIKKRGIKLILLPQALGPFDSLESRNLVSALSDAASLIFPREEVSLKNFVNAGGDESKLLQSPDFTNLVTLENKW